MRRLAPLAIALSLAAACAPAAAPAPPVVAVARPATALADAPPAPTPPATISAGGMPADVQLYLELSGAADLTRAVRGALGEAVYGEARAEIAKEMGVAGPLVDRLVASVASLHLGGRRAGGDVKVAVSAVLSDPAPLRELIAAGVLVEGGARGPFGRFLRGKDDKTDKGALLWFEGARLLVLGDDPMVDAVTASMEGRAPMLVGAQRAALATVPGERRVADAFITPALLDDLTAGKVSLVGPIAAAFGLADGGLRGSYQASIAAPDLAGDLPLPPPRALALARRLPAETTAYLAISTALPGGPQGALQLFGNLSTLDAGTGKLLSGADLLLQEIGLGLADIVGGLGDEAVIATLVRPEAKTNKDIEKGSTVVYLQEVRDERAFSHLLNAVRDRMRKRWQGSKQFKLRPDRTGVSVEITEGQVPYARVKLDKGLLFIGAGKKEVVERAAAAADKGKGTLGDDGAHARALTSLPPSAQARLWLDFSRMLALSMADPKGPKLDWALPLTTGSQRLSSALSLTVAPEDDRLRFEVNDVNGILGMALLAWYGSRH